MMEQCHALLMYNFLKSYLGSIIRISIQTSDFRPVIMEEILVWLPKSQSVSPVSVWVSFCNTDIWTWSLVFLTFLTAETIFPRSLTNMCRLWLRFALLSTTFVRVPNVNISVSFKSDSVSLVSIWLCDGLMTAGNSRMDKTCLAGKLPGFTVSESNPSQVLDVHLWEMQLSCSSCHQAKKFTSRWFTQNTLRLDSPSTIQSETQSFCIYTDSLGSGYSCVS